MNSDQTITISLKQARRLACRSQLLDERSHLRSGKDGVLQVIDRLGYIQIDPINVIQRAHHHTLWTRLPDYQPETLHQLQIEGRLFEYWGHALAYFPISEYRYCLPRMRNYEPHHNKWAEYHHERGGAVMQLILERIRQDGPKSGKDLRQLGCDSGSVKSALEMLFWKGEIMVRQRRNFERIFDLAERVLPEDLDTSMPTTEQAARFFIRRALQACGVAQESEIQAFMQPEAARDSHYRAVDKNVIRSVLSDLTRRGEVVAVRVSEMPALQYYILKVTLDGLGDRDSVSGRVFLLSPFDNLMAQRKRIRDLFGFDYKLEAYTPAAKRTFGFFALPFLWRDEFVGCLDPKADRKSKTLVIHHLQLRAGFEATEEFVAGLTDEIKRLARFNECENIVIEQARPKKLLRMLPQTASET